MWCDGCDEEASVDGEHCIYCDAFLCEICTINHMDKCEEGMEVYPIEEDLY